MPRIAVLNGVEVKVKTGSLRINKSANARGTLSATIFDLPALPELGDAFGLIKDIAPGSRAFNGTSSVVARTFASSATDNFLIAVWARPRTSTGSPAALYVGLNGNGYGIRIASGEWGWHLPGVNGGTDGPAVVTGEWVHLAFRRVSGVGRLFVNGLPVGATTAAVPVGPTTGYLSVGARRNTADTAFQDFFDGELAHALIQIEASAGNVLSDAQILAMAQGGPGGMGRSADQFDPGGTLFQYYPILGLASPEPNTDASASLTVTNAPASTDGPVVASADADYLFGGEIDQAPYHGIGGRPLPETEVRIGCGDYQALIGRVLVSLDRPAENLKARLTAVLALLSAYGVTLDAAQDNGPSLPARSYDDVPMGTVIEELSVATERLLEIDETRTARMLAPSGVSAPWDIEEGDGNYVGDISVEPTRRGGYANHVVLIAGTDSVVQKTDTFTGNGSTSTFALTYTPVTFRGLVTHAGNEETLGVGASWTYDAGTNSITRNTGAPSNGAAISIVYGAKFPIRVTATDAEHATAPVEVRIENRDIFDLAAAQAQADAELAARLALGTQRTIKYTTHRDGLRVGMTQHLDVPDRELDDAVVLIDLQISDVSDGESLSYAVTAVDGVNFQTWRQKEARYTGGGSSQAISGGVGTYIVPVAGQDSKGNILAQEDTDYETEMGLMPRLAGLRGLRVRTNVSGTGLQDWFVGVIPTSGTKYQWAVFDENDGSNKPFLGAYYSAILGAYVLGPPENSPLHALDLGRNNSSSDRIRNVFAQDLYGHNGITERGRSTYLGVYVDVPHNGANFTGTGTLTWTVDSGDQLIFRYTLIGGFARLQLALVATTIAGTGGGLQVALPFTPTANIDIVHTCLNNGTQTGARFRIIGGVFTITLLTGANWAAATNTTSIWFEGDIPV